MTDKLSGPLLAMFAPRPPLRYLPHPDYAAGERSTPHVTGIAHLVDRLKDYDPGYKPTMTAEEQRSHRKVQKAKAKKEQREVALENWNPKRDPKAAGDPYKTLFIGRLSYSVDEQELEREFGRYGQIESIRIVKDDKTGKPLGYAFIAYRHERDMRDAYKDTNGIRIKDRRIVVDVERGRTVRGWKPRRLGGGLGGRGYTAAVSRYASDRGRSDFGGRGRGRGRGGDRPGRGGRGGFRDGGFSRGGGSGGYSDRRPYDADDGRGRGRSGGIGYRSSGRPPPNDYSSGPSGPRHGGRPSDDYRDDRGYRQDFKRRRYD